MTALHLTGIGKTYPGAVKPTLHGLDLTVESGKLTALLGPSGSGKTTVMKLIAGLLTPDAGDILLDDHSITQLPPDKRGVVMVFQNPHLFPHLTLAGNVGFGLRMRGVAPARIASETAAMLDLVQLQGLGHRRPSQLSGGQQQRAALARALVLRPKILLLDEPLSNLDATLRDEMRSLIRDLQRQTGITTLVVTHDQTEAVVLADRIALLLDGRLAQHAAPEDLYQRPASEAVARFFGGVNFIDGRIEGHRCHSPLGPLDLAGTTPQGPARLTIRPEALRLGPGPNACPAAVRSISFLGTQCKVEFDAAGLTFTALLPPAEAAALTPGQEVTLSLPPQALWVLPHRA
jgi:ABC-type Fe3+/spermidine/putrescine transport system ATPase subunit